MSIIPFYEEKIKHYKKDSIIPLKNPLSSSKYLGCWIIPIQLNIEQYNSAYDLTTQFGELIKKAILPRHITFLVYTSIYLSKIRYILPSENFNTNQIKNINAKLNSNLLPLLQINSKTPKAVIYGP